MNTVARCVTALNAVAMIVALALWLLGRGEIETLVALVASGTGLGLALARSIQVTDDEGVLR